MDSKIISPKEFVVEAKREFESKYPQIAEDSNGRMDKALDLALSGFVHRTDSEKTFIVLSQKNPKMYYTVENFIDKDVYCDCMDFWMHNVRYFDPMPCKHILAVWIATEAEDLRQIFHAEWEAHWDAQDYAEQIEEQRSVCECGSVLYRTEDENGKVHFSCESTPAYGTQDPKAEKEQARQARRAKFRELAKTIADMSEGERAKLAERCLVTTVEGHTLSPNNQMLVALQMENATLVGGFRQWRAHGRAVKKGEHGIMIWIPKTGKTKEQDDAEGANDKPNFLMGYVFDVAQTMEVQNANSIA